MILLVAAAWAGQVVVAVREVDGAFSGAIPRVTATDAAGQSAQVDMQDLGAPPDASAGDAVWTGATANLGAGPYTLLVTDGGDVRVWKGQFAGVAGDPTAVRVTVQAGGVITEVAAAELPIGEVPAAGSGGAPPQGGGEGQPSGGEGQPSGGGGEGGQPNGGGGQPNGGGGQPNGGGGQPNGGGGGSSSGGGSAALPLPSIELSPEGWFGTGGRTWAWALVAGAFAWVLAGARRFTAAAVDALPGPKPPIATRGVVPMDGEWDAFVRTLAGPFRVILAGEANPGVVPAGTVFPIGTGRVAVDDLIALLRHIEPSGPPVALVIVGGVEGTGGTRGEAALAELGERLPKEGVAYVFADAASRRSTSATPI